MAYVELDLPKSLPDSVHTVIRKGVELLLQDVHWLLATVIAEPTDTAPPRQLQIPIAHMLLAMVAGVSTKLLHAPGNGTGVNGGENMCRRGGVKMYQGLCDSLSA